MIVANLPYVAQADLERLPRDISEYEPLQALDGGVDGLAGIEEMLAGAGRRLLPGGSALFEIGCDQGNAAQELARTYFPASTITLTTDLSGLDRVVSIHTPDLTAHS
jgi:release factor glutamine methyltransferase